MLYLNINICNLGGNRGKGECVMKFMS